MRTDLQADCRPELHGPGLRDADCTSASSDLMSLAGCGVSDVIASTTRQWLKTRRPAGIPLSYVSVVAA